MKIFPAIDIQGGRVVRLKYGDYNQVQVYQQTPRQALAQFQAAGADCLHVVDLDGAKDGQTVNFTAISPLLQGTGVFCEVGGGIRDMARADAYLAAGAGRVILGTAALRNRPFLLAALQKYGERIAVGVDARDGKVAVEGWLQTSDIDSVAFCRELQQLGVATVIYTDISKDGAEQGTNLPIYGKLSQIAGLDIVASGGISSLEEIRTLRDMGVSAAILGKALYSGRLDLALAIACAAGKQEGEGKA